MRVEISCSCSGLARVVPAVLVAKPEINSCLQQINLRLSDSFTVSIENQQVVRQNVGSLLPGTY